LAGRKLTNKSNNMICEQKESRAIHAYMLEKGLPERFIARPHFCAGGEGTLGHKDAKPRRTRNRPKTLKHLLVLQTTKRIRRFPEDVSRKSPATDRESKESTL